MKRLEKTIIESIDQSSLKMTDLGFSVSQMVRSEIQSDSDETPGQPDADDDETYLESALQMGRKRRTGQRGRPKNVDYGFVRSTTHKMAPDAARLMGAANQAFVGRQLEHAQELLLRVIQLAPTSHEAYSTLGLVHEERGERGKASGCYMLAAMMNPADTELWLKLAQWAELDGAAKEGKREEAVFCYGKAISALLARKGEHGRDREEPADGFLQELFHRRARLHLALQQPADAVKSYYKLLALRVNDAEVVREVVGLAVAHSIPPVAADVVERAARQGKGVAGWPVVETILELLFMSDPVDYGRVDRVCKEVGVALVDQSELLSHPEWGSWAEEERDAVVLSRMPFGVYLRYAIASVKLGRASSIDMGLIVSHRVEEQLADSYYSLADALHSCLLWEPTVAVLQLLLSHRETWSIRGCCLLGRCLHSLHRLRDAEAAFKVCLATDPGHEEAQIALATVYQELGDERGIVETLESGRRFRLLKRKSKPVRVDLDKDDEVWRPESDSAGSSSSEGSDDNDYDDDYDDDGDGDGSLFVSASKGARKAGKVSAPRLRAGSSRIDHGEDDCNRIRQEYQRVVLALQVKAANRELYSDALLAAHQLIQEGLLCNPNVMITSGKRAKWLLAIDWSTERSVLKGLLLSEWALLITKYCSAISELFKQTAQACSILVKLHQESMVFKLCDTVNECKLRVTLAEVALLSSNLPAVLLAIRPLVKAGHNPAFSRWFWGHLVKAGHRGRDALLSSRPFARFVNRHVHLVPEGAERDAMLCLQGHLYAISGSWEEALRTYLLISDDGDMKRLLVFNVYYHRAQQRTCSTQRWFFLKALACLDSMQPSAVRDYNKGRCFHGLGVLDGAARCYLTVLRSTTAGEGVKRVAAYNLHLICRHESSTNSILRDFM